MHRIGPDHRRSRPSTPRTQGDVTGWITERPPSQIRGADGAETRRTPRRRLARPRRRRARRGATLLAWPFGENGRRRRLHRRRQGDLRRDLDRRRHHAPWSRSTWPPARSSGRSPSTRRSTSAGWSSHPDTKVVQAVRFSTTFKNEWDRARPVDQRTTSPPSPRSSAGEFLRDQPRPAADRNWIVTLPRPDDGPVAYYAYNRDSKKARVPVRPTSRRWRSTRSPRWRASVHQGRAERHGAGRLPDVAGRPSRPEICRSCSTSTAGRGVATPGGMTPRRKWFANRGYADAPAQLPRLDRASARPISTPAKRTVGRRGRWQDDPHRRREVGDRQGDRRPGSGLCIYGGSYGRLRDARRPLVFHARAVRLPASTIVGPSNIQTLFASIPPYWAPIKSEFVYGASATSRRTRSSTKRKISPAVPRRQGPPLPLIIAQGANEPAPGQHQGVRPDGRGRCAPRA